MSVDLRLLGGVRATETVEALDQSKRRWILCSRDFCRTATLLEAITNLADGSGIAQSFPAASALDGNRLSSMRTGDNVQWVRLALDTQNSERKALLWLEYFEGEEIEPVSVEFSADGTNWSTPWGVLTALYRGERFSLWKLPYDNGSPTISWISQVTSDGVTYHLGYGDGGLKAGMTVVPQTGPCAGIERRIFSCTPPYDFVVESPWPENLAVGVNVALQNFRENWLYNPCVRIKVRNRWHPTSGPVRLIGMSLFDYYMELKGDKGQFQRLRAPNPTSVNRKTSGGILHECINGNVIIEQRTGPKRTMQVAWPAVYAGFFDFLESFMARGIVGIVDEDGRYQQGILLDPDSDRLERAVGRGEESSIKTTFREV